MSHKETVTISVEDLELYIAKGLYDTEFAVENYFKVSASLTYDKISLSGHDFVNYEKIAGMIDNHMNSDYRLLETIASNIMKAMTSTWPFFNTVTVTIRKCNPAFEQLKMGAVVVQVSTGK